MTTSLLLFVWLKLINVFPSAPSFTSLVSMLAIPVINFPHPHTLVTETESQLEKKIFPLFSLGSWVNFTKTLKPAFVLVDLCWFFLYMSLYLQLMAGKNPALWGHSSGPWGSFFSLLICHVLSRSWLNLKVDPKGQKLRPCVPVDSFRFNR